MGNGNRSGVVGGDGGSEKASLFDCDVGLGLKMQTSESFPCKRMMGMPPPQPYHHHHQLSSSPSSSGIGFGAGGGTGTGGSMLCNTSNQVACMRDIYDVVGAASVSGGAVLPRTLQPLTTTDTSFKSLGGGMPASGKVAFTVSQWQELERQTMIYKYMMASIPVPPELILPLSKSPSHVPFTQSNNSALNLRFSSGSDPEPWRCRRTDGKKWRCSRDVAPDQKYCERHAHKSRPRSRKPVESQSHNTTTTATTTTTNSYTHHPLILPSNTTTTQPFQNPISHFSTFPSATSYDQTRSIEWFVKSGTIPLSTSTQQWQQQLTQSSSRVVGLKRNNPDDNDHNHMPVFQQRWNPMNLNPYTDCVSDHRLENQQVNGQCCALLSSKLAPLQGRRSADPVHTTRHFIDAWSKADREDVNEISNKCSVPSSRKLPTSSLTLSMSNGNGNDEDIEHAQMGLMTVDSDRDSGGAIKSQWLSPVSWMGSPPGGPLGEALCLGIANTAKAASSSVPSSHGHSNSTTTSSCSRSSCEDGGHAHNFIR